MDCLKISGMKCDDSWKAKFVWTIILMIAGLWAITFVITGICMVTFDYLGVLLLVTGLRLAHGSLDRPCISKGLDCSFDRHDHSTCDTIV